MSVQHLNYCRQMTAQLLARLEIPTQQRHRERFTHVVDLAMSSTKYLLPPGGKLLDDPELRALDGQGLLRLPQQSIALEYSDPGSSVANKCILFAREWEGSIEMLLAFCSIATGEWLPSSGWSIPLKDAIQREGGRILFQCHTDREDLATLGGAMWQPTNILASFLNALACSNVRTERSEPRRAGKKIKAALPFDAYHILTIEVPGRSGDGAATGGHRSPREHLRRGHIRRLSDGRRIWVNAAIVAAGRGAGAVSKAYAVRPSR